MGFQVALGLRPVLGIQGSLRVGPSGRSALHKLQMPA